MLHWQLPESRQGHRSCLHLLGPSQQHHRLSLHWLPVVSGLHRLSCPGLHRLSCRRQTLGAAVVCLGPAAPAMQASPAPSAAAAAAAAAHCRTASPASHRELLLCDGNTAAVCSTNPFQQSAVPGHRGVLSCLGCSVHSRITCSADAVISLRRLTCEARSRIARSPMSPTPEPTSRTAWSATSCGAASRVRASAWLGGSTTASAASAVMRHSTVRNASTMVD
jgi:hypothetical protein